MKNEYSAPPVALQGHAGAPPEPAAAAPSPGAGGHPVARPGVRAMQPWQLEERHLIARGPSSHTYIDACRAARTGLLGLAGERRFVTLVVGVTPHSGASFLARNLAAAFTFDGTRSSLLVDCNLHHPVQHDALGVDPAQGGLLDFLDADASSEEGAPRIYSTAVPELHLLPAGRPRGDRGAESFSSPRMNMLLGFLQHRYPDRYVFLDGPPVEGSPDASILGQLVDFVVLVVGYGRATPDMIRRAALQFPAAKRAGVVFNEK